MKWQLIDQQEINKILMALDMQASFAKFKDRSINHEAVAKLASDAYNLIQDLISCKWNLISTAPKDATIVLVYCAKYNLMFTAYYTNLDKKWNLTAGNGIISIDDVTHWHPLPAPPKDEK